MTDRSDAGTYPDAYAATRAAAVGFTTLDLIGILAVIIPAARLEATWGMVDALSDLVRENDGASLLLSRD